MKSKKLRSILGLNTVKSFIVVMLSLAIIGVVTLIVLAAIAGTNIATGSTNASVYGITNNVSLGISNFFGNATTYFSLLGVVVIILIISLVVVVVNRFGGGAEGGSL